MMNNYSMKKAVIINACGKYSTVVLQLIVNAILARLVSPDDFGIIAIVTVFSTFFMMISDMGFSTAIVQRKDLKETEINNIFSFTVVAGVVLALLFCGLGYVIASFYKDEVFVPLSYFLSISLFFNTINMVPNGKMNRDKRFVSIAVRTVVSYAIAAAIAIGLALAGWRYYAVVIQTILSAFIIFVWNYIIVRPRLYFKGCIKSIKKIINYSGFQFAFNIVNYFSRNLDNLLTGKYFGKADLGYYNKAYQLMLYPVNNLAGVVTPAVHPILSDYQDHKDIIYQKYIKLEKVLFICAGFIAPFCFLASREIILIMYGNQWMESIACFTMLSLAILPQFVGSPTGAIYQSLGKTKLLFINSIINTFITIAGILIGIIIGGDIVSLSTCVAISYIVHFFTTNIILVKVGCETSFLKYLRTLVPNFLVVIAVYAASILYPFEFNNIILSIAIKGIYLGVVFVVMLFLTREHKVLLELIRRKRNNERPISKENEE